MGVISPEALSFPPRASVEGEGANPFLSPPRLLPWPWPSSLVPIHPPPYRIHLAVPQWWMVVGKLSRHADTHSCPMLGTLASCSPPPATSPSIISSIPAWVIGGLVTDGLINSLISALSLPARPPAQVGTNSAGCRDGHPEATAFHCCTPKGHLQGAEVCTRLQQCPDGQHCPGWHMALTLQHRGAWRGPHPRPCGWCHLAPQPGEEPSVRQCRQARCPQVPAAAHLPGLTLPMFAPVTAAAFRLLCAGT